MAFFMSVSNLPISTRMFLFLATNPLRYLVITLNACFDLSLKRLCLISPHWFCHFICQFLACFCTTALALAYDLHYSRLQWFPYSYKFRRFLGDPWFMFLSCSFQFFKRHRLMLSITAVVHCTMIVCVTNGIMYPKL